MQTLDTLAPPRIGTLLGIWAHPDDEAYLSSGLMATVRQAGGRVVVVTATRGEHGTDDPVQWPPRRLARQRSRELRRSLDAVGVHEHCWLKHRDGELGQIPLSRGVAELVPIIDRIRPDTLVTFGPDGFTGHGDHQAISAWVTEAWRSTGSRARLWYPTLTPGFHEEWSDLNAEVGHHVWFAGPPPTTAYADLAAEVRCSGELLERKHRALRAHGSQTLPLETMVGSQTYRDWWAVESFVAATPS